MLNDMLLALIVGFILGAAALLFITENTTVVALTFMQWQFQTSIALLVLLAILVGVILMALMFLPGAIGDSFRMRRLQRHNEALAREAESQRQAALQAQARLDAANGVTPGALDLSRP